MTTKNTMTLSLTTLSLSRALVERDLECYESNMRRKCYDYDAAVKADVAQLIEHLQNALNELDYMRSQKISQL